MPCRAVGVRGKQLDPCHKTATQEYGKIMVTYCAYCNLHIYSIEISKIIDGISMIKNCLKMRGAGKKGKGKMALDSI